MPVEPTLMTRNRLLATMHPVELESFTTVFAVREARSGDVACEPHKAITEVVFPINAVYSMVGETSNGERMAIWPIGNEGVIGMAPFLGAESSVLRTICQVPGTVLVASIGDLYPRADGALVTAIRRYALACLTMAGQGAVCNRLHSVEQRVSRWLLMLDDRVDHRPFGLTHEFFAIMLGSSRPTISVAVVKLRKAGLIEYQRGRMAIVDRGGLEQLACECYQLTTIEYERATRAPMRQP
jgi:hypothetical protein